MIKKIVFTVIVVFLGFGSLSSQNLEIPFSSSPIIDGVVDSAEWSKADTIAIEISSIKETTVYYMHDSTNFYAAFVNNLQSGGSYFPELLFDTDYDTAASFQTDDWWFHVSATDCEYQGQYGNYSNCSLSRPNWKGVPNFALGTTVDTVEIEIPLDSIGVSISDTIGVGFLLNNFLGFKKYPTTLNHLNPKTFLPAIFETPYVLSIQENKKFPQFKVYPIPNSGVFQLSFENDEYRQVEVTITNLLGEIIYKGKLKANSDLAERQMDISSSPKGIYILTLSSNMGHISKKIVVQ